MLADSIRSMLERKGFQVECVYDGESGKEYALLGIYDLLILDGLDQGQTYYYAYYDTLEISFTPEFGGGEGERPSFGGEDDQMPGFDKFSEMETTTVDIGKAHISVEIEGGKESGSMDNIVPGAFVTVMVNGKGEATYVLVSAQSGFGFGGGRPQWGGQG